MNPIEADLSDYFELLERATSGAQGYPSSYDCSAVRIHQEGLKRDVIPSVMMPSRLKLIDNAMLYLKEHDKLVYNALENKHRCRLPVEQIAIATKVSKRQYFELVRHGMYFLKGAYAVGDNTLLRPDMA